MARNPYLPVPKTAAAVARERHADEVAMLAQRRAYLASGACTDIAILAEIRRQIAALERLTVEVR